MPCLILRGRDSAALSLALALALAAGTGAARASPPPGEATASGSSGGTAPAGAIDGDRFRTDPKHLWKGDRDSGWWQIRFPEARAVGAILQINGDDAHRLHNAPRNYAWQWSSDGQTWRQIPETVVPHEKRLFRIHRLKHALRTRYLRLWIYHAEGDGPAVREVEFYPAPDTPIPFGAWIVAVSSLEDPRPWDAAMRFVHLARQCQGWEGVPAQCLWHGDFDEPFVAAEPRPLCAFFSGSLLEWCQCSREPWRGVQEVLRNRNLPMWGACGGAQVFAILEETGVDRPWDCPRCRDPNHPKLPIYSHIGHTGPAPCGDYSRNVGERGKYPVRQVARDPVFAGLPEVFAVMESHIGQIAYPPAGWVRVATRGPGGHTVNQCLRVKDRYIYAAQFHAEAEGTPETSRTLMSNFLRLARQWGGYNPDGKAVPPPEPIPGPR